MSTATANGKVAQIFGPVVDVRFPAGELPAIYTALRVDGTKGSAGRVGDLVLEVTQHLGNDVARCVAMATTDGCRRGMDVERTRADKWTSRLGLFLQKGPSPGTWETRSFNCLYTHYIAPHPDKADAVLIAQVSAKGVSAPRAVSRWLVPRFFFRAPAHLFFSNYVRTEGPIGDEIE